MELKKTLDLSSFTYDNREDIPDHLDYISYNTPVKLISFCIPSSIDGVGKCELQNQFTLGWRDTRYDRIMGLIHNLIYLNPSITNMEVKQMFYLLNSKCTNPLWSDVIQEMYDDTVVHRETTNIFPMPNKLFNYIFNKNLKKNTRSHLNGKLSGIVRSTESKNKLITTLGNWRTSFGKITHKSLSEKSGLGISNVTKLSKELAEHIMTAKEKYIKDLDSQKPNTLKKIKMKLKFWKEEYGSKINANIAEQTGFSLDTIKKYSPMLKELKKIPIKQHDFFEPFDSKFYGDSSGVVNIGDKEQTEKQDSLLKVG
jgi:hypothetical protein